MSSEATSPAPAALPHTAASAADRAKRSYGQIVKSNVLVGGASVLNIGFSMVRAKAMSIILGPAGFGLFGTYWSLSELTRGIASMGINGSGVRQIAAATATGDSQRIARTVTTLRRVALVLGAIGAVLLVALARPISQFSFKDDRHAGPIALLALAVFFGAVSSGQNALVQGMRRIADIAKMNVLGAFYGTLFSIPIVYYFSRQNRTDLGVVLSLVCVAGMSIITSWWYSRKVKVEKVSMTFGEIACEASELLKLGAAFMAAVPMAMGAAYLIRIIVTRQIDDDATGYYQAAWALSGTYVGFILQAMSADFYPRLTAAANDKAECNRLVNEQAEVSLLMAGPGLMAAMTFSPLILHIFYSSKFAPAAELLRWNCIGMLLQVASWPMGFIVLAKGKRAIFIWAELISYSLYVALVWFCIQKFRLAGAGIAFCALYAAHWWMNYGIARWLTDFRLSAENKRIGSAYLLIMAGLFVATHFLSYPAVIAIGGIVTLLIGIFSVRKLCTLVPFERFPRRARQVLQLFRLAPHV